MSARPGLATLPDAELELLVSRSLDGDLSPEEERELSAYLAAHPEARVRYAEMEAVVQRLHKLPAPEPPFALATRVTSQVSDRSKGIGALGQRFGLYLPPGLVAAGIGILALGGVLAALFGSPRRAERIAAMKKSDEGPVRVFFQEAPPAPTRVAAAQAAAPRRQNEAERVAADETAALQKRADAPAAPAGASSSSVAIADAKPEARMDEIAAKDRDSAVLAEAAPRAAEPRAGFAPEPAAPAPAAKAAAESRRARSEVSADTGGLTVALVSGAGWRLVAPPPPPAGAPADAKFRLVLEENGRVARVDRSAGAPSADMERYLSSLVFERAGAATRSREVDVRVVLR